MVSRKRTFEEVDANSGTREADLLTQVRNSWELACLMQFIFFFGKALKIDEDLDIEALETACILPSHSEKLTEIGLQLLKFVSSHRGLTPELFEEYTRRQYLAKAPGRNPFGTDEEPLKFAEFDVLTKLRVLHQLSIWTLNNPDRIRERMEEKETEQTIWRIEPLGWDAEERAYFILDDNRLYRRTEPPPPAPVKPKSKTKSKPKSSRGQPRRASKRQKLLAGGDITDDEEDEMDKTLAESTMANLNNGLGGAKWEVVAITLEDYNAFIDSIRKSRDPDEKSLCKRIVSEVLPSIEQDAEAKARRAQKKQRELENLQRMASAKRSGRLADKQEKQRAQEEATAAERKKQEDLAMARREIAKQQKLEHERESRMITREQRLKDREVRRILHEEELAKLEAENEIGDSVEGRVSERHRQNEKERRQKELEKLDQEAEDWDFDCAICGVHGRNLDDGTHSLACEKCGVWQHSACHGIKETDAERDDFHFLCASCSKPKISSLKLRMPSNSPRQDKIKTNGVTADDGTIPIARPIQVAPETIILQHDAETRVQPVRLDTQPQPLFAYGKPTLNGTHAPDAPPTNPLLAKHETGKVTAGISSSQTSFPPPATTPNNPPLSGINSINGSFQNKLSAFSPSQTPLGTPHNPFRNDFARQRPSSAQSNHSFASPTPSLSATQGNTDLRFSPTKVFGSPNSNSYAPAANRPAPSAYSPTKHDSSPHRPQSISPHAPSVAARSPLSSPYISHQPLSPTRNATILSPGPVLGAQGLGFSFNGSSTSGTLPPVPTLSPSINTGRQNLEPPMKKAVPDPGPVLLSPKMASQENRPHSD